MPASNRVFHKSFLSLPTHDVLSKLSNISAHHVFIYPNTTAKALESEINEIYLIAMLTILQLYKYLHHINNENCAEDSWDNRNFQRSNKTVTMQFYQRSYYIDNGKYD